MSRSGSVSVNQGRDLWTSLLGESGIRGVSHDPHMTPSAVRFFEGSQRVKTVPGVTTSTLSVRRELNGEIRQLGPQCSMTRLCWRLWAEVGG